MTTHSRLRVLIDARMLLGRFSGVARFVTSLVDELAERDGLRIIGLCGDEPFAPWRHRDDLEMLVTDFRRRDRTAARRLWWEQRRLSEWIRRADADVYHATWNSGIPRRCPARAILTIHDLIPLEEPAHHFTSRFQAMCYRRAMHQSARRADVITTVSEYTCRRVLETLSIGPERVVVVSNGVAAGVSTVDGFGGRWGAPDPSDALRMRGEFEKKLNDHPTGKIPNIQTGGGSDPYVLYVGGHEPRKNVAGLFRAMRSYWARFDRRLELWLTGTAESLCKDAASARSFLPKDAPVRFLGTPSHQELAALYAGAACLVMPSLNEGFGLPVVEAFAHGCPVIAARRAALPEVVGEAGLLIDPENPDEIAEAIQKVVAVEPLRAGLIRRARARAAMFSWRTTAERMADLYVQTHRRATQEDLPRIRFREAARVLAAP